MNHSFNHIRKELLTNQLNKIDINQAEYSSFTDHLKNTTVKSEQLTVELMLDIILIQLCRMELKKADVVNLISNKKHNDEFKNLLYNVLVLDKDSDAELKTQIIENETIYYFTISTKRNYIYWDVLLPGIYIFSNTNESTLSFNAIFSYYKHKNLFKNYDAISNQVKNLKQVSFFSPISKKYLSAEEYYLDYLTLQALNVQENTELESFKSGAMLHHLNQHLICFQDRTLIVREFYKTIKNNKDMTDCLKAEILLGLAGKKVSRLTMPKILADDLHGLWNRISAFSCASSFLVKTKNEGLGNFSNIPQGFVLYTNHKNIQSNDLIFIYIAESQNRAAECARLDEEDEAGDLLGIPKCCVSFYKKYKQIAGHLNPFLISAKSIETTTIPWQLNFYAMYQGSGLLWHFPCSQNCDETIRVINERYNFMNSVDPIFADKLKFAQMKPIYFINGEYQGEIENEKNEINKYISKLNWK